MTNVSVKKGLKLDRLLWLPFEGALVWSLKKLRKRRAGKKMRLEKKPLFRENEKILPDSMVSKWKFPGGAFVFEKPILLKETNMIGNTYYDNYISWQGEARERLLLHHPALGEWMKNNGHIKMITHSVHHQFLNETTFGDVVQIKATTREIKKCSFVMDFIFTNFVTGVTLGKGWQRICFADVRFGKLCSIPRLILDLIEPIEDLSNKLLQNK